jgi:hypothetical protein
LEQWTESRTGRGNYFTKFESTVQAAELKYRTLDEKVPPPKYTPAKYHHLSETLKNMKPLPSSELNLELQEKEKIIPPPRPNLPL